MGFCLTCNDLLCWHGAWLANKQILAPVLSHAAPLCGLGHTVRLALPALPDWLHVRMLPACLPAWGAV